MNFKDIETRVSGLFRVRLADQVINRVLENDVSLVGGVTVSPDSGSAFDLNDATTLNVSKPKTREIVKRVVILEEDIDTFLDDKHVFDSTFMVMFNELYNMDCYNITFKYPGEDTVIREYERKIGNGDGTYEIVKGIELRAYGLQKI